MGAIVGVPSAVAAVAELAVALVAHVKLWPTTMPADSSGEITTGRRFVTITVGQLSAILLWTIILFSRRLLAICIHFDRWDSTIPQFRVRQTEVRTLAILVLKAVVGGSLNSGSGLVPGTCARLLRLSPGKLLESNQIAIIA